MRSNSTSSNDPCRQDPSVVVVEATTIWTMNRRNVTPNLNRASSTNTFASRATPPASSAADRPRTSAPSASRNLPSTGCAYASPSTVSNDPRHPPEPINLQT
uniref:(northern house mosquito) hypothetical protein n=1 Tax=Culex pipiens TaxID=7175 RepID=A0A8D8DMV3_CULPI